MKGTTTIYTRTFNLYSSNGYAPVCSSQDMAPSCPPTVCHYPLSDVPDGVFILTDSGRAWLPQYWGLCKEKAESVLVCKGQRSLKVALFGSEGPIHLLPNNAEQVGKEHHTLEEALQDFQGYENTQCLLASGSKAASFCKDWGSEWHIPSLGEFQFLYDNHELLDAALTIAGGRPLPPRYHVTSTRKEREYNYFFGWNNGNRDSSIQGDNGFVRCVAAVSLETL